MVEILRAIDIKNSGYRRTKIQKIKNAGKKEALEDWIQ